ncbi:peptidoglycan DD-metalloendopeptidase family protein [Nocardioides sp.]|uniref:peptidoglycan DD-metalloendopeptidase family protein n=1 Tax=Nocardioides sp. TaxID=35761 RepID=UPI002ED62DC5
MRSFPRTARRRLGAAGVATLLTLGVVSVPLAHADDLKDKQKRVQKKIEHADHALEESSDRLNRALERMAAARAQLRSAMKQLQATRQRLFDARERDREMQAKLELAQERLERAKEDLEQGRLDLADQRDAVTDMITTIYQEGDPELRAFSSMLTAQSSADLTWTQEGQQVMVGQETRQYDELRAAEVLLEVREDQLAEAEAQVALAREAAAEHLEVMKQLTAEARAARERVRQVVAERAVAKRMAVRAKRKDRAELRELKQEENRIERLIAAQAAKSRQPDISTSRGGFLSWPMVGGYVTSPYGYRTHPIYGYYALHNGTDFGGGCGVALPAAAGGRVVTTYYSSSYGNRVIIYVGQVNGKNLTIIYNHLSHDVVSPGQRVSRGQVVGYSGSTGWSTACHLHFTVMVNGATVDPMGWL